MDRDSTVAQQDGSADAQCYEGWLRLRQLTLPCALRLRMLEDYPDPARLFVQSREELAEKGYPPALYRALACVDMRRVAMEQAWLRADGHHLVTWQDVDYPRLLREIPDPPVLLFGIGERQCLRQPQFAIVGSRRADVYGCNLAVEFARRLSEAGFSIASGLAQGIDCHAHQGALRAGGSTVAVLGNGLADIYPRRHRAIASRICDNGILLSELSPDSAPLPHHFPLRNRIISGISVGVLLVQAARRSGSLITARHALEQGREVFAVPGSIHNPLSSGCHWMLRQGARLVERIDDILSELDCLLVASQREWRPDTTAAQWIELDPQERLLLERMGHEPVTVEQVMVFTGLTERQVSIILLNLELKGMVGACPGGRYLQINQREKSQPGSGKSS